MRRLDVPGGWPALGIAAAVVFLYLVRGILAPFIVATALAYILSPLVTRLQLLLRVGRLPAVALVYVFLIGLLTLLWILFGPTLARETVDLVSNAPSIIANLLRSVVGEGEVGIFGNSINAQRAADYLITGLTSFFGTPREAAGLAAAIFEALLNGFLTLVVLFYLLVDRERFTAFALRLLPPPSRARSVYVLARVDQVLSRYVLGLLTLIAFVTVMTWLGLALIFRLPYSLPLAVATGFLEIIPFVGPITAGTIAGLVALTHGSVGLLVGVALFYLILRQIEDQIVAPFVLGRAVALHPVSVIFSVLAGGALAGILGVLLAIPVAAAVKVLVENWQGPPVEPPPEAPPAPDLR